MNFVYNADGTTSERQFTHNDKLIRRSRGLSSGYSIIKYSYDKGRVAEIRFFDNDRKPVDAVIDFDRPFSAHRVVFKYVGSRIVEESFYLRTDESVRIVDCLQSNFLSATGMSEGRKNVE
jgi:hypothetical protein